MCTHAAKTLTQRADELGRPAQPLGAQVSLVLQIGEL